MNATLARLRRLLVMVPWLLEHPGVPVEEAAARFDVTSGEVLDDLDVLGYCGLPGYGGGDLVEVSVSGGRIVVRMADFFSRPLALTLREGLALLLAARATRASGILGREGPGPAALDSAIAKLEEHLGADAVVPVAMDLDAGGGERLSVLWPAVAEGRVVRVTYRSASKQETTRREVEPWALRSVGGAWYLQGWCRLSGDERSFRLDRIRDVEVTEERVTPRPVDAEEIGVYVPSPEDHEVVLDVAPAGLWIADHVVLAAREPRPDGGDGQRLTFRTGSLPWAAALVVRLGPAARVVSPAELSTSAEALARRVLVRYAHRI